MTFELLRDKDEFRALKIKSSPSFKILEFFLLLLSLSLSLDFPFLMYVELYMDLIIIMTC